MHIVIFDNLIIHEWLNGGLLPLNLSLLLAIGHTLYLTRRIHGRGWTWVPGIPTACALWWIFFADGLRAGLVWLTLRQQNEGGSFITIDGTTTYFYILAAAIGVLASLRCIYLFTPKEIGHLGWIVSAISTVTFVVFSHLV